MKTIYVYVMDTMATWEIGYLLQGFSLALQVNQEKSFDIKTVAVENKPVRTLDGLTLVPDMTLDEMCEDAVGLILPGGVLWHEQSQVIEIAKTYLEEGKLLAGICGATLELAKEGILNRYRHTSNSIMYLKLDEHYSGDTLYENILSVRDKNLITASAAGSLEFARDIMAYFELYTSENLELWYDYYKTGHQESLMKLLNY